MMNWKRQAQMVQMQLTMHLEAGDAQRVSKVNDDHCYLQIDKEESSERCMHFRLTKQVKPV